MTCLITIAWFQLPDVVYDLRVSSRRRWPERPTTHATILHHLLTSGGSLPLTSVRESAKAVIDNELAKCDPRGGLKPDLRIYHELFVKSPNRRPILRNLYWHARRESAVEHILLADILQVDVQLTNDRNRFTAHVSYVDTIMMA